MKPMTIALASLMFAGGYALAFAIIETEKLPGVAEMRIQRDEAIEERKKVLVLMNEQHRSMTEALEDDNATHIRFQKCRYRLQKYEPDAVVE